MGRPGRGGRGRGGRGRGGNAGGGGGGGGGGGRSIRGMRPDKVSTTVLSFWENGFLHLCEWYSGELMKT